jgi:hypothetical protein
MATQLRAVQTYSPDQPPIMQITYGLDELRCDLLGAPRAKRKRSISPSAIAASWSRSRPASAKQRDAILSSSATASCRMLRFDKIVEGVETGARRRLTITAEVQ